MAAFNKATTQLNMEEAHCEAIHLALGAEHLPDVILMDLRLPDMDGIEAARILANGARTAAIPVVALSAVAFEGDTAWLTSAGFAGYLEKPIDIENFPHQVRRFCA